MAFILFISKVLSSNIKGTLTGLTCFGNWKSVKNDEKCFLFYHKSSFRSQDI